MVSEKEKEEMARRLEVAKVDALARDTSSMQVYLPIVLLSDHDSVHDGARLAEYSRKTGVVYYVQHDGRAHRVEVTDLEPHLREETK